MKAIIKNVSYPFHAVIRSLPIKWLSDHIPPLGMNLKYFKYSKKNPFGIKPNLTNQSICAKHCGSCASNPFTHGGLYCISGKSKKNVEKINCNCFDCELFESCGGGLGYFCSDGSGQEINQGYVESLKQKSKDFNNRLHNIKINKIEDKEMLFANNTYEKRFILPFSQAINKKIQKKEIKINPIDENKNINIKYITDNQSIKTKAGKTILNISLNQSINHMHACGGQAKCSTCRVLVTDGLENLLPRNDAEIRMAKMKKFPNNVRLACQTKITGDISIRRLITHESQLKETIQEGRLFPSTMGEEKELTILFVDIRNFTSFSERNLTYDVVHMLNRYFEVIGKSIDENNGYIDKYIGDGVMAIFGLNNDNKKSSQKNAMLAAIKSLDKLRILNVFLKNNFNHEFEIAIGIHSGKAVIGYLGFHEKRQFTAIGDVVNTAARIESAAKQTNSKILISREVFLKVSKDFNWKKQHYLDLKGKEERLTLYEPDLDNLPE